MPRDGDGLTGMELVAAGVAFETRFGRPRNGWRRTAAAHGVFYTRRGLRVLVALVAEERGDVASLAVSRFVGNTTVGIDEILEVRADFLPGDLRAELSWTTCGTHRVPVLEAVVPAALEEAHRAAG